MQNICVYCASSTQVDKLYLESAAELGRVLVENGMNLVWSRISRVDGCIS